MKSNTIEFWRALYNNFDKYSCFFCHISIEFKGLWSVREEKENIRKLATQFMANTNFKYISVSHVGICLFSLTAKGILLDEEEQDVEHHNIRMIFLDWIIDKLSE